MPQYYTIGKTPLTPGTLFTANGTPNTISTHLRMLTVANQLTCRIMGVFGNARFGTAGGGMLALIKGGAAGTGGTAVVPALKNKYAQRAADTTAFSDATAITAGTTPLVQQTIGIAQTGGQGGWVALETDDAHALAPNGGANGNAELASFFPTASVTFDATIDFTEN